MSLGTENVRVVKNKFEINRNDIENLQNSEDKDIQDLRTKIEYNYHNLAKHFKVIPSPNFNKPRHSSASIKRKQFTGKSQLYKKFNNFYKKAARISAKSIRIGKSCKRKTGKMIVKISRLRDKCH